jgi:integrase
MGLISDNPAKKAAMPAHRPDEARGLEPGQAAAFLQAARSDRLYSLYVLAVDSGCRQGELLALSWRDIDFDRATVAITKSLEEVGGHQRLKEPKTVRSRRIMTISQVSLDALQEHRRAMLAEGSYGPDRPVFCGPRRGRWYRKSDLYRQSFQPILKRAGLSFKFHTLRHACASFLLTAGTDIKTVQERLGHSTATMTLNTYSHVLSGAQAEAARRLQVILTSATASAAAGA